jgi:ADP-ribose pyrophosphatase YjhB (NUDIX family)
MGYIMDLRKEVGNRPLNMVGACVILLNKNQEILLQFRKDNNCWGLAGGSLEMGETLNK